MSPFDLLFKKKKKKKRHPLLGRRQGEEGWLEDGARLLKEVISSCDGRGCYPIQMFSAQEIEQAIGQIFHDYGWSVYYEGTHEDRQIIIKVYRIGKRRELAFNEIATVTQINHANVAKLLGCCFEMEQPILIYEYVPFILSNRLREANPSSLISWEHRSRIAIEIAYAITYLHMGTSRPIVHRDIKSSNILLDEHNKPKLADFSLSIAIPSGETQVETPIRGTFGYIAPDYFKTGIVSEKSDVYSYGVLLLELISGKRTYVDDPTEDRLLHKFLEKESTEKEERLELILLNGLSMDVRQVEQAMACMEVAVGCISRNPDERPAMKEVAQQLEQIERGHPLLGRRQGEQGWLEDGARLLKEVISSCDGRGCYPIRMFSAKEIEQAIGQIYHREGFYDDYEGTHEDRQIIIKVYRIEHREWAFNEIATVTQIKHANVAKLLGCCFEMEQPILIYEYVPFILLDRLRQANHPSSSLISWERRLRIAIEIAYAVTYLHIGTSRPVVHRDIKSRNILLDDHYKPKLADFSLSITIPFGETQVETTVSGTVLYIAPDYLNTGIVSEKSDVYSYGVVLLELLSGKNPHDDDPLLNEFIRKESTETEERLELILHNGLSMDVRQVEQAMACMEVAVGCISRNPDERLAMKEVAQQLEQIERGELPLSSSLLRVQQLGKYKVE